MIKDPVFNPRGSDATKDHFAITDEPIFWIEENSIGITRKVGEAFWYINKADPDSWYISGFFIGKPGEQKNEEVSAEQLVEYLAEHWPDHLEWLLWHPEWFSL